VVFIKKFIETKENRLIGKDKLEYSFEILAKDDSELLPYEAKVFNGLKKHMVTKDGLNIVTMSSLKNKFYVTAKDAQDDAVERMTSNGYFVSNPVKAGGRLFVIGGVLLFFGFFAAPLGPGFMIGMILAGIVCLGFGF